MFVAFGVSFGYLFLCVVFFDRGSRECLGKRASIFIGLGFEVVTMAVEGCGCLWSIRVM